MRDFLKEADSVLAVLLAGGLSRRMGGGDKGLMPLGNKPVIGHVLTRSQQMTDRVIINANGDPGRFAAFDVPIVPDTLSGFAGPLAGVLAGLRYAQKQEHPTQFIVTVAADTPFFPASLLQDFLAQAQTNKTIVLANSNGRRHPVFGLWPVALADDLENWLEDESNRKVLAWVTRHDWATAEFTSIEIGSHSLDPFFNINTPEDFEQAQMLLNSMETV